MQKICIWHDKYHDCFCGVYEIDTVKGETTLLTEIIYPYNENGWFKQQVIEWVDKYANSNQYEIQLCTAEEALKRMRIAEKLSELAKDFELPNFLKQNGNT